MVLVNLLIYLTSFIFIWLGSGMIVRSVNKFSRKLRFSPFAISFILLGLLTSIPEFAVGMQAVSDNTPEIFIGNLIGGIAVLFLFVIPILAVLGNGINLKHELDNKTLLVTLSVILSPSILILDKRVSNFEGIILVILYFVLLLLVEKSHGIFDKGNAAFMDMKAYSLENIIKLLTGIGIVFVSSSIIVDKTELFAQVFNISPFYLSLVLVSLGTNLPELSLAARSIMVNKSAPGGKDIAMGDYMGSAAANTLLFGIFTILNNGEVLTITNYYVTFVLIFTALFLFFVFSASKKFISRIDGLMLLVIYLIFLILEFAK